MAQLTKVYMVQEYNYEDKDVVGVFTTMEKAKEALKQHISVRWGEQFYDEKYYNCIQDSVRFYDCGDNISFVILTITVDE